MPFASLRYRSARQRKVEHSVENAILKTDSGLRFFHGGTTFGDAQLPWLQTQRALNKHIAVRLEV